MELVEYKILVVKKEIVEVVVKVQKVLGYWCTGSNSNNSNYSNNSSFSIGFSWCRSQGVASIHRLPHQPCSLQSSLRTFLLISSLLQTFYTLYSNIFILSPLCVQSPIFIHQQKHSQGFPQGPGISKRKKKRRQNIFSQRQASCQKRPGFFPKQQARQRLSPKHEKIHPRWVFRDPPSTQ